MEVMYMPLSRGNDKVEADLEKQSHEPLVSDPLGPTEASFTKPLQRGRPVNFNCNGVLLLIVIWLSFVTKLDLVPFLIMGGELNGSSMRAITKEANSIECSFSTLSYKDQCPGLKPIDAQEFDSRRNKLATLLAGSTHGESSNWGAYISEPGPNTLYYLNISQKDWSLSERPWLMAITPKIRSAAASSSPSTINDVEYHLSILTPSFEKSRSQQLPFSFTHDKTILDNLSWVTWEEAESPYEVLVKHLSDLEGGFVFKSGGSKRKLHLEENVRQFVADGLSNAISTFINNTTSGQVVRGNGNVLANIGIEVGLADLVIREQRMKKTQSELAIQRCAAKVTLEALKMVRKMLRVGMSEKEAENEGVVELTFGVLRLEFFKKLIEKALTAAGLTELDKIVLFGDNAALPHASASVSRTLKEGEFALFDVGGSLFGYESDLTRTVLPGCANRFSTLNTRAETIWNTVRRAQEAALQSLVSEEGNDSTVYAADVDKAARTVIAQKGWGQYFSHRLGHGIGIQVHEHPYLNSGNHQPIVEGETFSNEPGIYIEKSVDPEGVGIGVRLEDMVLKTERGWELLTGSFLATSPWEP